MDVEIEVLESFECRGSDGKKKKYLAETVAIISERIAKAVIDKGWARPKVAKAEPEPMDDRPEATPPAPLLRRRRK